MWIPRLRARTRPWLLRKRASNAPTLPTFAELIDRRGEVVAKLKDLQSSAEKARRSPGPPRLPGSLQPSNYN